jgi:uncharacterized coiled-coil protein SlyX
MHPFIDQPNKINSLTPSPGCGFIPIFSAICLGILGFPSMQAECRRGCDGDTTFFGESALKDNSGGGNSAFGGLALFQNTTGFVNTAIGSSALFGNTTGQANTGIGAGALQNNHTGSQNTATGQSALQDNVASNNTADGYIALFNNTTGTNNTAVGSSAMGGNPDIQTTGSNNTASGYFALRNDTTGEKNTALGANALTNNTSGNNNIAVGYSAGTSVLTTRNNIDVGNTGVASDSGVIRIGTSGTQAATFIAGIRETPISGAMAVGINANGQLGVRASSARFKKDIKPMDQESEAILALRPVSFRYRDELDPTDEPQFGLVAEEVEKIDPELITRDATGKPFTVRYEAVDAMLLNEFLKQHRKVEAQEKRIGELEAALKEQAAQIEKVSAQLAGDRPAAALLTRENALLVKSAQLSPCR